jgi:hypothetical protein
LTATYYCSDDGDGGKKEWAVSYGDCTGQGVCTKGSANCDDTCECNSGYEWSGSACVSKFIGKTGTATLHSTSVYSAVCDDGLMAFIDGQCPPFDSSNQCAAGDLPTSNNVDYWCSQKYTSGTNVCHGGGAMPEYRTYSIGDTISVVACKKRT